MSNGLEAFGDALEAATGHGVTAASIAVGYGVTKKVFGPTLDAIGVHLADVTRTRLENLDKISEKAERLGRSEDAYPHIRVTQRVLNDATLYDDDVQQTYVAGLLAGSRNDDGSDDRPVFYLSVIDALTASQLSFLHVLYCAAAQALRDHGIEEGGYYARVRVEVDDFNSQMMRLNPDDQRSDPSALFALAHAGLIDSLEMWDDEPALIVFRPTRVGVLLFDWAYGFDDEDIRLFASRDRPDIGLPELVFTSVAFSPDNTRQPPRPA